MTIPLCHPHPYHATVRTLDRNLQILAPLGTPLRPHCIQTHRLTSRMTFLQVYTHPYTRRQGLLPHWRPLHTASVQTPARLNFRLTLGPLTGTRQITLVFRLLQTPLATSLHLRLTLDPTTGPRQITLVLRLVFSLLQTPLATSLYRFMTHFTYLH